MGGEDSEGSGKPIKTWTVRSPARTLVISVSERLNRPPAARTKGDRALLFLLHFCAYCGLVVLATLFDPFGAGTVTERHSQDVINRVLGTDYPQIFATLGMATTDSNPQVGVVLIDEDTLVQMTPPGERRWPARPSLHATFLEGILAYKPRAVMVDLLFVDALQGRTGAFERALRNYDTAGVPLVFAAAAGATKGVEAQAAKLPKVLSERLAVPPATAVTPQLGALVAELPHVSLASVQLEEDDDGTLRHYPLKGPLYGQAEVASAAVTLFGLVTGGTLQSGDGPMTVFWPLDVKGVNRDWMNCREAPGQLLLRIGQAFLSPESLRQDCPATATVPALELLIPTPDGDADARGIIEGNVVFYGTDIIGDDTYVTPVNSRLPGVYVHAMTLDNLLRLDGRYLRDKAVFGSVSLTGDEVNIFIAAPVIGLLVAAYLNILAPFMSGGSLWRTLAVRGGLLLAVTATSLALAFFLLAFFYLAPLNWIGLPLIGLPIMVLADNNPLKKHWGGLLRCGSWCRAGLFPKTAPHSTEGTSDND